MKFNIKHIGLSAMALIAMASCSDVVDYSVPNQNVNTGAPEILNIYDVQDTAHAVPLASGELNQMIHVMGRNLANATKIYFNDVAVDVRQVYCKSNEAWIKIPRVIPGVQTDSITYETPDGTVKYKFPVTIPHVQLEGLVNEFALQGSRVQLNGDYMDLYNFNDTTDNSPVKIYVENVEAGYHKDLKCDSCTENYTSITIPKDCPDNSLVHFEWKEIDGKHTKTVPYRMTSALWTDANSYWDKDFCKKAVTDGTGKGDPQYLGYSFLRLKGSYDAWSWNDSWSGLNWEYTDAALHPENYVFKFEVSTNVANPFLDYGTNGTLGDKNGGYRFQLGGGNYQFDPVYMGITNTEGKWVTVSIPLVDLLKNGDEQKTLPTDGSWVSFGIVYQPQKACEIDHSFGQFRIEPKNY